jgi:hypothetical protein
MICFSPLMACCRRASSDNASMRNRTPLVSVGMAGVRNSGEIPLCLLMEDDVDTGSTLVRPVEIHHRAQELRPIWNLREMVEKCSYQGMKLRDDIALWNSRLCCGVVSEEQQKLPNLLLHAIFRIGEIVPDGPTVLSPQTPKSWSNVFPDRKMPSPSRRSIHHAPFRSLFKQKTGQHP